MSSPLLDTLLDTENRRQKGAFLPYRSALPLDPSASTPRTSARASHPTGKKLWDSRESRGARFLNIVLFIEMFKQ